jgi:ribosome-associated protein
VKKARRFIRPGLRKRAPKPVEVEGLKSRSQIKREMTALQELGAKISDLPSEKIKDLALPRELEQAVLQIRAMKSREARRRQVQYIGALMRTVDPEPVRRAYQELFQIEGRQIRRFQEIERWRDELLRGNDAVLDEIARRCPAMDRQQCLALVKDARREPAKGGKKGSRALFRYLKEETMRADRMAQED